MAAAHSRGIVRLRAILNAGWSRQAGRLPRPRSPRDDELSHPRGAITRPGLAIRCPSRRRGRRECRALNAPVASWAEKGRRPTSVVTTGSPKRFGTPCAMALRLTPYSPRGIGLVSPRRLRIARKLDTSVEVTGPHGLTVRFSARRLRTNSVHRIPRPTFVTIATRPPVSAGRLRYFISSPFRKEQYFCARDWTSRAIYE